MLFNSIDFAIFLPIVFLLYWWVFNRRLRAQNFFLLIASYLFYGWWDWRFLGLIFLSSLVDYFVGQKIAKTNSPGTRKGLLALSLTINLGSLGVFKYFNFFVDSLVEGFSVLGYALDAPSLNVILPVGISFYTFQTLSYTIDVYRGKIPASRDFIAFLAFVSFFPQLVAGPIERAAKLLPQFSVPRKFSYPQAINGLRQILWGLFKKIVIADNCAELANLIFNNSGDYSGSTLVLGALFFTFQIYGDFSGYSDIAIGTARLFGFDLMRNFAFPYFSRNIGEFWRRWHISLSTWFRDYLYIPLGGSKGNTLKTTRNVFIIFLVSGFWHGANWTFVVWGGLNALFFLPLLYSKRNRRFTDEIAPNRAFPSLQELLLMLITFGQTVFAWIFFRAESMGHAGQIVREIFSPSLLSIPVFAGMTQGAITLALIGILLVVEWIGRNREYALAELNDRMPTSQRWVCYYSIALVIVFFGNYNENPFIYFQF